jgi:hypothetical protein
MLGFGWIALREVKAALRHGRLEEAQRLLGRSEVQRCGGTWPLQQELARGFIERAERHLRFDDSPAAWKDLLLAEQVGAAESTVGRLRQDLTRLGVAQARALLEAGEPARAAEVIAQLRDRAARHPELELLDEVVQGWTLALEMAGRGEFGQAVQTADRLHRLLPSASPAVQHFQNDLRQRRESFLALTVQLHEALAQARWSDVARLSDQVLVLAPRHLEARKARDRAWKALDRATEPAPVAAEDAAAQSARSFPRFLLWIDGVGGYLVCLANRVTVGQATGESQADVPLFADLSRVHASLTRDAEGYVLEAARRALVNGQPTERAMLQSGDRVTLGHSCQLRFSQAVPVSATARLDVTSGHRLPVAVEGVFLMADTLVLGPGSQVHVPMPDLQHAVVLYRNRDGLGIRHGGNLTVDGRRCGERGVLGPASTACGDDFALSVEALGPRWGGSAGSGQ